MPGAQCTRSFMRAEQFEYAHEYSQRRHRNHPAFPTQWSCGFLRTLPGDRAFLPPSPARRVGAVANLAPASGRQDHTASPYASRPRSSVALLASTASHPTFVTIAIRPLARRGSRDPTTFSEKRKKNIFHFGTGRPDQIEPAREIRFCAHAVVASREPPVRAAVGKIEHITCPSGESSGRTHRRQRHPGFQ
jgi:hypothetical protein